MTLQQYDWLLFDADETLFSFDAFAGLQTMFRNHGVDFTAQDYVNYQQLNKPLWDAYQAGSINAAQLQRRRFAAWAAELECSAEQLNAEFIAVMAQICQPLEGARTLLQNARSSVRIGIVTNGFTDLQQARLEQTKFAELVDLVVISEQVGVAKPDPKIFAYALQQMQQADRSRVLMTGDNPHSDIVGAQRSGLHACWLNQHKVVFPLAQPPQYEVSSLTELQQLLLTSNE